MQKLTCCPGLVFLALGLRVQLEGRDSYSYGLASISDEEWQERLFKKAPFWKRLKNAPETREFPQTPKMHLRKGLIPPIKSFGGYEVSV